MLYKSDNKYHWKDVTQTRQQRPESPTVACACAHLRCQVCLKCRDICASKQVFLFFSKSKCQKSTHMGDNYCRKDVTLTQQQKPESPSRLCTPALPGVPLWGRRHHFFWRMYVWQNLCTLYFLACLVSYRRQLGSLLLCLCDAFWATINSCVLILHECSGPRSVSDCATAMRGYQDRSLGRREQLFPQLTSNCRLLQPWLQFKVTKLVWTGTAQHRLSSGKVWKALAKKTPTEVWC